MQKLGLASRKTPKHTSVCAQFLRTHNQNFRSLKSIPQSFVLLLVHWTILPKYWRIFVFSRRYCENNSHELLPDVITDLIQKKRHFVIATYFSMLVTLTFPSLFIAFKTKARKYENPPIHWEDGPVH